MERCTKDTHHMAVVGNVIMKCYCGHLLFKLKKKKWVRIKMKKWRVDFTIERYGDMTVEAETEEEARTYFDKMVRKRIKFTHGHTYDWDVKTNYIVETENKPSLSSLKRNSLVEELVSPLYSQVDEPDFYEIFGTEHSETDPLVSYIDDGSNGLPWL